MDASNTPALPAKPGPMDMLLITAAGYEESTLSSCTPHDWNIARGRGVLMIVYTIMEAVIYSYVLHRLLASPGELRPWLIVGGIGMALLVTIIDLELIIKPTAVRKGHQLLKRGGLDLGLGASEIMALLLAAAVRITLALGISQLNGIFISTLVYDKDIGTQIHNEYAVKNASQIARAEAAADANVQRLNGEVAEQTSRVIGLGKQLESLRQTEVEAPGIQDARNDVNRLVALKAKTDEDLRNAEKFASDEGAGIRGAQGNSGHAGYGLRYRAAVAEVSNAGRHAQDVARELDAARARLDALQGQKAPESDTNDTRVRAVRSELERTLASEREKLADLKRELGEATGNREKNVRDAVERAPDHVAVSDGLVGQLKGLEAIAQEGWTISTVIVGTDVLAFALELCAVLARTLGYATVYDAMLVRNIYMSTVAIAEQMDREFSNAHPGPEPSPGEPAANSEQPAKRKRGRPPKDSGNGSSNPALPKPNGAGRIDPSKP
jgi:hypothetical protein